MTTQNDTAPVFALTRPLHVGTVTLAVQDLGRVADFYEKMIGLSVFEKSANGALLGVGDRALLRLESDSALRPQSRRAAGLFHTAFLVPNRTELGRWLAHAAQSGVRLEGASDHLVSEAIYLSDPEGNGIEIYTDRHEKDWKFLPDGTVEMATYGFDLQALYDAAPKTGWTGMANGTSVGHIHLQVGDTGQAEGFYHDLLGLSVMAHYPGASFMASGGYHHHLGANVWNSRGAGRREANITGLSGYTLHFNDLAERDRVLARLAEKEVEVTRSNEGHRLSDPWGIAITLTA